MDGLAESGTLYMTRTFPVARETVFRALTDPGILAQWWGPRAQCTVELHPAGRYRWAMHLPGGVTIAAVGSYEAIAPPEQLVCTFSWEGEEEEFQTRLTLEFRRGETGTELTLRQEGFADAQTRENHRVGWNDCLDRLERWLGAA